MSPGIDIPPVAKSASPAARKTSLQAFPTTEATITSEIADLRPLVYALNMTRPGGEASCLEVVGEMDIEE